MGPVTDDVLSKLRRVLGSEAVRKAMHVSAAAPAVAGHGAEESPRPSASPQPSPFNDGMAAAGEFLSVDPGEEVTTQELMATEWRNEPNRYPTGNFTQYLLDGSTVDEKWSSRIWGYVDELAILITDREAAKNVDKARADFLQKPTVALLDQFEAAMNTLKQQIQSRFKDVEMLEVYTGSTLGFSRFSRYIHLGQVFNPVVTERILT